MTESVSSLISELQGGVLPQAIQYVIAFSPIILVLFLLEIFVGIWVTYVRAKNFLSIKYCVIEIRLPKDTFKSPLAMEVFFTAIHNTGDGTWFAQYWRGETRPWYSLELVSIEGQVKFMMWMEERRKANLVSALYSQFPGIEVFEREDYARSVHFDPETMRLWAGEFTLTKDDAYPIKTYVDYGLDKDPKEEYKVDPLIPLIEFLGSIGPNQQVWIQILVRGHKGDQKKPGHFFKKTDRWKDSANKLINDMMVRDAKTRTTIKSDDEDAGSLTPRLSKGESSVIEALERSVSKYAFDVGLRAIYWGKKEAFNGAMGIGGIIGSFKHFSSDVLNGFKPTKRWHSSFEYPWQDYKDIRKNRASAGALMAYKRRSYFYTPFESSPFVLNTEELATIYHFPGAVAATPTLERVPSKKAQAPANLPI